MRWFQIVNESPIADYQFFDRSEEPHPFGYKSKRDDTSKVANSFPPEDLRALRNPKWTAKLIGQFGKSQAVINLYVMNARIFKHHDTRHTTEGPIHNDDYVFPRDGVRQLNRWGGTYLPEDFEKTFGFLPPNYEKCINVVLTNNWGDARVPLTPWMVAHRIIHALGQSNTVRLKGPHFFPFEHAFEQLRVVVDAAERTYFHSRDKVKSPLQWNEEDVADFYQAFGTFSAARNRKVLRRGEFYVDASVQTLLFGKPSFNLDWCTDETERKHLEKLIYQFQLCFDEALYKATGVLIVF